MMIKGKRYGKISITDKSQRGKEQVTTYFTLVEVQKNE